jgi:hypothetical protein
MTTPLPPSLIAVAGPSGSGKTTWISQFLQDSNRPCFYLAPGASKTSVDLARIGYRFPWVQVIADHQTQSFFEAWIEGTLPNSTVYLELGFHLGLDSPFLSALPWHRVAVLPPDLATQGATEWHDWADEIVPGNDALALKEATLPNLWLTSLSGQVFDPPSLDEALIELTEGAYGKIHRAKGIFELPDGRAFYVDFVNGLPGIEYTELNLPPWLDGRPDRPSGIEVVGWDLQQGAIAQTLLDSCLSDDLLHQYQQQYKATLAEETIPA